LKIVLIRLLFMLSTLAQLSRAQSATAPVPEANPGRSHRIDAGDIHAGWIPTV